MVQIKHKQVLVFMNKINISSVVICDVLDENLVFIAEKIADTIGSSLYKINNDGFSEIDKNMDDYELVLIGISQTQLLHKGKVRCLIENHSIYKKHIVLFWCDTPFIRGEVKKIKKD